MKKILILGLMLFDLFAQAQNPYSYEQNDSIIVATNVCKKFYADYCHNILMLYKQQGTQILLTKEYPLVFVLTDKLPDNTVKEKTTTINNIEFVSKINLDRILFSLEQSKEDTKPIKVEMVNGVPSPIMDRINFNITRGNIITSSGYYLVNLRINILISSKRLVFLNGGIIFTSNDSQGKYLDNTECVFDGVKYVYKSNLWIKQ